MADLDGATSDLAQLLPKRDQSLADGSVKETKPLTPLLSLRHYEA